MTFKKNRTTKSKLKSIAILFGLILFAVSTVLITVRCTKSNNTSKNESGIVQGQIKSGVVELKLNDLTEHYTKSIKEALEATDSTKYDTLIFTKIEIIEFNDSVQAYLLTYNFGDPLKFKKGGFSFGDRSNIIVPDNSITVAPPIGDACPGCGLFFSCVGCPDCTGNGWGSGGAIHYECDGVFCSSSCVIVEHYCASL